MKWIHLKDSKIKYKKQYGLTSSKIALRKSWNVVSIDVQFYIALLNAFVPTGDTS